MKSIKEFGPMYQYGNEFWDVPQKYDYINLFQEGEMYNCYSFTVPEHIQHCAEISYIISGSGYMTSNEKKFEVKAGDLFLSGIGERHCIFPKPQENLRFFYLGFTMDEDMIKGNAELEEMWFFFRRHRQNPISQCKYDTISLMSRLNNEFYSSSALSSLSIENVLKQILVDVYRSYNSQSKQASVPPAEETSSVVVGNTIYNTIRYIEGNIFEITQIQEIAKALGYSNSYLSHAFQKKVGMTLQQYLTSKKIEKSLEMIHSGKYTLTQVSENLNYDSLQSFSRVFKRVMGSSPSSHMKESKSKKN